MADLPPYPGAPRWVKVFGIVVFIVLLLFIGLMHSRGRGRHGPGRHMMSAPAGRATTTPTERPLPPSAAPTPLPRHQP